MNLMVHPSELTSHADPHDPHSELPPSSSLTFPPPSTFTAAEQPPPVTTVSLLRPDPANLSSSLPPFPPPSHLPFLVTVSSSPGTGANPPAAEKSKAKLAPKCFPPALGPTTGAQPLSEGGGEVRCRAVVECGASAQWSRVQCGSERRQPAGWSRCAPLHSLPILSPQNHPNYSQSIN